MRKPLIGISAGIFTLCEPPFMGTERSYVNHDYIEAIERAGGIPVILPSLRNTNVIEKLLKSLRGLVLSGGADINPNLYNEEPIPSLGGLWRHEADEFQIALAKEAVETDKPLLGICRGHQILNVALGGTLYQDINAQCRGVIKHIQAAPSYMTTHEVIIAKGSLLENLYGESCRVNSFHHQAIKDVAPSLTVTAKSADGIIEAVQKVDAAFCVGVQWHPEMMLQRGKEMLPLFKEFIKSC